jgi:hypothetical protein
LETKLFLQNFQKIIDLFSKSTFIELNEEMTRCFLNLAEQLHIDSIKVICQNEDCFSQTFFLTSETFKEYSSSSFEKMKNFTIILSEKNIQVNEIYACFISQKISNFIQKMIPIQLIYLILQTQIFVLICFRNSISHLFILKNII